MITKNRNQQSGDDSRQLQRNLDMDRDKDLLHQPAQERRLFYAIMDALDKIRRGIDPRQGMHGTEISLQGLELFRACRANREVLFQLLSFFG